MKKLIFSSLFAVLLLTLCLNETKAQDDKVYSFVSMKHPPTYPGGIAALYKFLAQNIKYPKEAAEKNIQGNVFVSFIVGKDGSVSDIKVDRKIGGGTDEEAIRVLKMMKKWNPGTENGKVVKVAYNMPVKFTLYKGSSGKPALGKDKVASNGSQMKNQPSYPDGVQALYKFLGQNIKYPKEAVTKNIQGDVFVSFMVEADGSIKDIKVVKGIGGGADEEAVRVVKLMKKWNPAEKDGKPVRSSFSLPIKFTLAAK
ncbi:energy transducer TonB [Pedobacter sp. KR3-3]|uniref:Energy transducer TonB n=1 Tax=Pedobacter albus TaxID=3113905 RepID=A0ABU7I9X6_9SPHI|nr:energy transducer TonB [Pedobacter sp. KR3-3]MEE1946162.1 energy transducer TonB [Pedobacter sp. KR3-3]